MVEEIEVEKLKEYENNARTISDLAVEKVAFSIREYGFRNPILIDRNNVIVAGHTRRRAAILLKLKTVPCIRIEDLSEKEIREYRIADNKTGEFSYWDKAKLAEELKLISAKETEEFSFGNLEAIEVPDIGRVCPCCGYKWKE